MLEHYFSRPRTIDRIRASWIGDPIERYVGWMRDHGYTPSTIQSRVPVLVRFGEFAADQGARTWKELPEHLAAFVEFWQQRLQARLRTPAPRRRHRWQVQKPVEEMIQCALPEFQPSNR